MVKNNALIIAIVLASTGALANWRGTVKREVRDTGEVTLKAYGRATYYGPGLYGNWCYGSGIRLRPQTVGCALPRGNVARTRPSPFTGVPHWASVRIHCAETGKTVVVPVIDEGPALYTGAMIDLTGPVHDMLGLPDRHQNPMVSIRVFPDRTWQYTNSDNP